MAKRAAPVLGKSERQIENQLAGICDGKAAGLETLLLLVGIEKLAQLIEGKSGN